MAIVPEVAVARHMSDFIVRPLRPPLTRTIALIEHRNKPNEPALDIVRNALLGLRAVEAVASQSQAQDIETAAWQIRAVRQPAGNEFSLHSANHKPPRFTGLSASECVSCCV